MTLQELDVLGTWVAGTGTLLAVIVSLYLARTQGRIKLTVRAGERKIVSPGSTEMPDIVSVIVTNCSQRPAKITHISWSIGFFKKTLFVQMLNIPSYETLPKMLNEGEEGHFVIPYKIPGHDENWDKYMSAQLLKGFRFPTLRIFSLTCIATTSVGQQFKVRAEKNLRDTLLKNHKNR